MPKGIGAKINKNKKHKILSYIRTKFLLISLIKIIKYLNTKSKQEVMVLHLPNKISTYKMNAELKSWRQSFYLRLRELSRL